MKANSKPTKSMPYFDLAKKSITINSNEIFIDKHEACLIAQEFSKDVLISFVEHLSSRYRTIKKETFMFEVNVFRDQYVENQK